MNELPKELQHKVSFLPIEKQLPMLRKFKKAFEAVQEQETSRRGVDVLQKQLLEGFVPKGKPHATGGLIDGYATGGVSNLFRQRQGFRTGKIAQTARVYKIRGRITDQGFKSNSTGTREMERFNSIG